MQRLPYKRRGSMKAFAGFGAYLAWRAGDQPGAGRRLRAAAQLVDRRTEIASSIVLLALRMHLELQPMPMPMPLAPEPAVATLIRARESWVLGDTATAARLLEQSRSEGIDTTWFAEEAALLATDLGAPPQKGFRCDPQYPNRLRFVAVWELGRVRR